ncbi:hypothetical protein I9W82_000892 [Candida metapsilosis]|uniref:Uncharacterized protein n=1 Tax=Candida metapsilosis TaxID=273372 RepID=A0A8H7ZKN2_9ASCO|nr:hypothetical protein I9W82_000892 [Candida metapsilosis]
MELLNNDESIGGMLDTSFCFEQLFSQQNAISSFVSSNSTADTLPELETDNTSFTNDFDFDSEQFSCTEEMINAYASTFQWMSSIDEELIQLRTNSEKPQQNFPIASASDSLPFTPCLESPDSRDTRVSTALVSTKTNSKSHKKTLSLASPLQVSGEETYFVPTLSLGNKKERPPSNKCKVKQRLSPSLSTKSKSSDGKRFKGKDIFTYNFCDNNQTPQGKINKPPTKGSSQCLRPTLKPSVTITSIDALKRSQQYLSPSMSNPPRRKSPQVSVSTAPTIKNVGNPFYRPFNKHN